METIINNSNLKFLKFNNSITTNKHITKDLLKSQNEISINIDLPNLPNEKILSLYWKFHNFTSNIEGIAIKLANNFTTVFKNVAYYTLLQPFTHLPYNIDDGIDKMNAIYMCSFSFHCAEIFDVNTLYIKSNYVAIRILTSEIINDTDFNSNPSVELVV